MHLGILINFRKSDLEIEGFLFGGHSLDPHLNEQEVNLRAYLCRPLYKIPDYHKVNNFISSQQKIATQ